MNKTITVLRKNKRGRKSTCEKLVAVRARLRRGDLVRIASMTGYDISHVSRVISGEKNNPNGRIAEIAYSTIGKRKVTA